MGEALGGSVDAMMRAAGYTNMQDFFKAVEAGKLKSKDVLPKFAEEMKKMAREGGALDAVMNKTRAQMGRFFNTLTEAKDTIFQGGMDEGLGYMFGSLADSLERLAPAAKAFTASPEFRIPPSATIKTSLSDLAQSITDCNVGTP